jgi:hypothetical protein
MIIKKNWGWIEKRKLLNWKEKKEKWKKIQKRLNWKKKYNGYIKSEPPLIFPIVLVQ